MTHIRIAAWRAGFAGLLPETFLSGLDFQTTKAGWEQASRRCTAHVIESEGRVLGFSLCGASRDADAAPGMAEVIAIHVHPEFWRPGLGTKLLMKTPASLRQSKFREATSWVMEANDRARSFYEKLGWQADGAKRSKRQLTGFPILEVRYRISL